MLMNILRNVFKTKREEREIPQESERGNKSHLISFDKYYRYGEIQDYLHDLSKKYPKLVTLVNYGLSYEGRNLTPIYVSSGGTHKPIIFVDAAIHAREWIAPSQCLYIIQQIVEIKKKKYLRKGIDWILIPVLNPDGYEYTHTVNRLWRKTRSKGKKCDGVDPNRNFDHYWGGAGSSNDECSMNYAGPEPFSEPETLALSKLITKYANRIKLYLTFHSPEQCFLLPWGFITKELPSNFEELKVLGEEASKAVEAVNGTVYKVGLSGKAITYFTPGCSRDWAHGIAGIPLSYMMELPAGRKNRFIIHPERIYGIVIEMFEAVEVFHQYITLKYLRSGKL